MNMATKPSTAQPSPSFGERGPDQEDIIWTTKSSSPTLSQAQTMENNRFAATDTGVEALAVIKANWTRG